MDEILREKGKVEKIPFEHNTYNRYVGIAKKKREKKEEKIKEFIWLVDCRKKIEYFKKYIKIKILQTNICQKRGNRGVNDVNNFIVVKIILIQIGWH